MPPACPFPPMELLFRFPRHASVTEGPADSRLPGERVPFVGVIEAYVLRALRDIGMTMEEIRAAAALVREEFDDPCALARKRIATDGVKLFVRVADDSLVHGATRQLAIREVVQDYLRNIDWGKDGTAARLHLRHFSTAADVIIDPRFGWGSPVIADSKVRVSDIVGLWRAGERMATVAEEFGLGIDVVEDVLQRAA